MKDLISIIVPIYGVEKYLNRCVQSIVNQTYDNLEIILVDDGSVDRCPEMCDEWAQKDSRIVVVHKINGGLSSARNAGLDIAKGKYIGFVDSDDWVDKDMYEALYENLINQNAQIACCGRNIVYGDDIKSFLSCEEKKVMKTEKALGCLLKRQHIDEAAWDKLYDKDLFVGLRFPEGEINEDIILLPQIIERCKRVVHIGEAKYYYWQNPIGITKSRYSKKQSIVVAHMKLVREYIGKNHPNLNYELNCFMARYSLDMLENLLNSCNGRKVFNEDYRFYYETLKENYISYMKCDNYGYKSKVKGLLILFHLYAVVRIYKSHRLIGKNI